MTREFGSIHTVQRKRGLRSKLHFTVFIVNLTTVVSYEAQ